MDEQPTEKKKCRFLNPKKFHQVNDYPKILKN